jgi:hypothetical protein
LTNSVTEYDDREGLERPVLFGSTRAIVDPIYLGSDLDHGVLQGRDSPDQRGHVGVESLHLGDGIEAADRLIEAVG